MKLMCEGARLRLSLIGRHQGTKQGSGRLSGLVNRIYLTSMTHSWSSQKNYPKGTLRQGFANVTCMTTLRKTFASDRT